MKISDTKIMWTKIRQITVLQKSQLVVAALIIFDAAIKIVAIATMLILLHSVVKLLNSIIIIDDYNLTAIIGS